MARVWLLGQYLNLFALKSVKINGCEKGMVHDFTCVRPRPKSVFWLLDQETSE